MSAVETVIFQCTACQQKYRSPADQIGQIATCPKCGYQFIALDPSQAIRPALDDSIPVPRKQHPPKSESTESRSNSRESALSLDRLRMPREMRDEGSSARGKLGRVLFWGGALLVIVAVCLDTSVPTQSGGRMHNMARAANQLLLVLCGMAAMISAAPMMASVRIHVAEVVAAALWIAVVAYVLAVQMLA